VNPYHVGVQRRILQPVGSRRVDHASDLAGVAAQAPSTPRGASPGTPRRVLRLALIELVEHQVRIVRSEARIENARQRAGLAVARRVDDLEFRMLCTQTEQFRPRVSDAPMMPTRFTTHDHTTWRMIMQL
jgi:hypothetical protein